MNFLDNHSEEHVKDELKSFGRFLRHKNPEHQARLRAQLQNREPRLSTPRVSSFGFTHRVFPTLSFAVIAFLAVVSVVYQPSYNIGNVPVAVLETDGNLEASEFMSDSTGLSASSPSTFRNTFLRNLGKNQVPQSEIDAYRSAHEDLFEEDVQINLLSKEKDAVKDVMRLIEERGGFIEKRQQTRKDFATMTARIPKGELSSLRDDLRDFVKSDAFYFETSQAQNRTADVIVIDEKVQEVERAIVVLEEKLATENDPDTIKALNQELAQHYAYLKERQSTKETIMERVEYVDLSIAISTIASWWSADSYRDVHRSIAGYESPGFLARLSINALFVITRVLIFFSYTFWFLIPLVVWRALRRKRTSLFAGLD